MIITAMDCHFREEDLFEGLYVAEGLFGLGALESLLRLDRELATYHLCLMSKGKGSLFQSSMTALQFLLESAK